MKSTNLKQSDPISILSVLHNFRTVYDRNGIPKDAAMCLLQKFMKSPSKAALAHRASATKEDVPEQ